MKSIRQQFADSMLEIGKQDDKLIVLVGDISHGVLQPFSKACPGRFYNIGICEPAMVGMAAGLSKMGFHPVVHTISPFLTERSFEQMKLDFCYQSLGGNIVTIGGAFDYTTLGCTHHCYGDFGLFKTLPGVQIFHPASPVEFSELFKQNYRHKKLNYYRVPGQDHGVDFAPSEITSGRAINVRSGSDVTIVVSGPQLGNALAAADQLAVSGVETEIIYIHTIRPLDENAIRASAQKTGAVLVIDEHSKNGGLADSVLRLVWNIPGMQFESLSLPDQFLRGYGLYSDFCKRLGFTVENISKLAFRVSGRNPVSKLKEPAVGAS